MRDFIEYLHDRGGRDLNAEEIADLLWLAAQLPRPGDEDARPYSFIGQDRGQDSSDDPIPPSQPASEKRTQAYLPSSQREDGTGPGIASLPFRSPGVTALPQRLALGRALRPLKRTAPSPTRLVLDEAATVQRIADEGNWLPVLRPARERWLEVVLLADESPSMTVWYGLVGELQALLEQSGAFRTVQRWGFYADPERPAQVRFYAGSRFWEGSARYRSPSELNDPRGRRLILLVSDCVSAAWRQPVLNRFLADWKDTPATLVQVLPERLWGRTGLRLGREAALRARQPGQPNAALLVQPRRLLDGDRLPAGFPLPVVTLEPETLALWSQGLTAKGSGWMLGVLFPRQSAPPPASSQPSGERPSPDAQRILDAFRKTASEEAQRLARYLSAVPLNLPVMRLVQQVMFDEPPQSHLAEVLLSGLLQRRPDQERETHPDRVEYDFIDGARELLRRAAGERELLIVLSRTSAFVDANSGLPVDFPTLLADPSRAGSLRIDEKSLPFAAIAADTLRQMGEKYKRLIGYLKVSQIDSQRAHPSILVDPSSKVESRPNREVFLPPSTTIRLLFLGRQATLSQEIESTWQAIHATESAPRALTLRVFWVNSQNQALDALRVQPFSAIVLEVNDHRQQRTRFCQGLRRQYPELRIVAVSPEPLKANRFDFDQTIRLPLRPKAVENLVRLLYEKEATELHFGQIHLNLATRIMQGPRGSHLLPPKQCALLQLLLSKGEEVVSREEIMQSVWETEYLLDTRTLDVHVRWLREKIEPDPSHPIYLLTVRGQGFRLAAD